MTQPPAAADARLAEYIALFEGLTRDSLHRLDTLCAPDMRFRDPFNDVTGVAAFRRVLEKMFDDVDDPRFTVTDRARSDVCAYLRWTFTCTAGKRRRIDGVSEVHLNAAGKVSRHIDHWDAASQVYEHVPALGAVLRLIKRRLAAS